MATFTKLEKRPDPFDPSVEKWTVVEIVKVGNDIPANGGTLGENDMHIDGENWCKNFFQGGIWKQTSIGHGFRGRYAMIGGTYDYATDRFYPRQPFASWSLNANGDWEAPITYPAITTYDDNGADIPYNIFWNEQAQQWKSTDRNTPRNVFTWDSENLIWNQE